jgi:hypothetical protein
MPDDAPTSTSDGASLDDLERRLASFESATKRLNRSVGSLSDAEPTAAPGHTSPPRPSTRRLSESGAPRGEEISGLRPAVQLQGPQTGALTARARSGTGTLAGTPGFTSAYGKPAIAIAPIAEAATAAMSARPPTGAVRHDANRHKGLSRGTWIGCACVLALILFLALLPRVFAKLGSAAVWADERNVFATQSGVVDAVPVRVGDTIEAGLPLARIAGQDLMAPSTGTVSRLLVSPGMRIAPGEMVAVVAIPGTTRVVAALPDGVEAMVGDRVHVKLLGEGRSIDGSVELVLAAGVAGPWSDNGQPPNRVVIQTDTSLRQIQLGQGARVTLLGAPTAGRQLLFALRQVLPW